MSAVRVTEENVSAIMSVLSITDDMLIEAPSYSLCPINRGGLTYCNSECNKYGLSASRIMAGKGRDGACVLWRLFAIKNNIGDTCLYAPLSVLDCDCEDI